MTSTEVTSTGVLEESSICYDLLVFQTMVIFNHECPGLKLQFVNSVTTIQFIYYDQ